MKFTIAISTLLLAFLPAHGEEKPNLLFIYLDDFGWRDTGFMGSDFYETPNLDRLAAQSAVFTDAYSGAPNCAPSRACLLSGQSTPRHQVYTVGLRDRGQAKFRRLLAIKGTDTLDPSLTTWAHLFQKNGYRTATMGKWHLSDDPLPYGFDLNLGGTHDGEPSAGYYPPHPKGPGLENVPKNEYLTDSLNREAVSFIEKNASHPWMLYLTHFAVHTPLDPKKELLAKYQQKKKDNPGKLHNHPAMATMIEAVDTGVGQILEALEKTGTRQRTIIVFSSDNGGYGPATDMAPLKGYKGTFYEGGIRVPLFIHWPGVTTTEEAQKEIKIPVAGVDLYPTFCDLFQLPLPENQPLDGRSLVPLVKGQQDGPSADRPLFWHFPDYLQSYPSVTDEQPDPLFRARPCSVVRKGEWKLIQFFETQTYELYHLASDLGETTNLIEQKPEIATKLKNELHQWQKSLKAPIPTEKNPKYDPAAEAAAIKDQRS